MAKDNRPIITLACTTCRSRTYATTKNRKNDPDRVELAKFCPPVVETMNHRGNDLG